jgi:hypothetical protein
MVIGIHNLGNEQFFEQVLDQLAVFPNGLQHYLRCQDRKRERRRIYKRKFDVKLKQSRQQKQTHEEVFHEHTDNSYGPGVGLTAGSKGNKKKENGTNKEKRVKENKKQCKCGSTMHQRTTHRSCPLNASTLMPAPGSQPNAPVASTPAITWEPTNRSAIQWATLPNTQGALMTAPLSNDPRKDWSGFATKR